MSKIKTAITPSRDEDYAEWYQQVVKSADLAEHSPVRGCMVIKPWGYGIWENIQKILDKKFKDTGHKNAYFPLFVPLSFLEKEAAHVEGFAKECAIVTHHRLEKKNGKLIPAEDARLEEPLIIRPTSETIIGEMFSRWIESYRDLPLLINQWANIVRWEMRTRLFLRTTEFLWQEGHTAHKTKQEALKEVFLMLDIYKDFLENRLAIPSVSGKKTQSEKFPGADDTYSLEVMTQDRKALQACTSHDLGQNFSKASNIKFTDENGNIQYAWTTSWGISTRIIGALVMVHSDDNGLILPPKIAPSEIVIIPIAHSEEVKEKVLRLCEKIKKRLEDIKYFDKNLTVELDLRDVRGGEKKWAWVKKGVPLIVEIGPKDVENETVMVLRRDTMEKDLIKISRFVSDVQDILNDAQNKMFEKARIYQETHSKYIDNKEDFYKFFTPENKDRPEIHGGFATSYFCLDSKEEEKIKEDLSVTVRGILEEYDDEKACVFCRKKTKTRAFFAKSY